MNNPIPFSPDQLRLYLVTDDRFLNGRSLTSVVDAAVRGGAGTVQLRCKHDVTRDFLEKAVALKTLLHGRGVPLLINDRLDIALAMGADGVHIGQDDMPFAAARALLPAGSIIGLSVETPEEVAEAEQWDVDYIAASPVFATPTKTDTAPAWGLDGLARISRMSRHPLVAIGGITPENTAAVLRAGADGVAVVSGIMGADDPCAAAACYRRIIQSVIK